MSVPDHELPDESAEERAFRLRARAWLQQAGLVRSAAASSSAEDEPGSALFVQARAFQSDLGAAGFAGLTWPIAYGGQELSDRHTMIFQQESAHYVLPNERLNVGLGMCGPTILAHGSEELKQRYIRPLLAGREIWCQLFSEPEAGSDLAAVRTRARRAPGGGWRVDGHKIWTSYGRFADYGLALVRTDPDAPKHAGLTMMVVDMKAPGVRFSQIRQMTGQSRFDEVFLEAVTVPDGSVVAGVGDGWRCALTTLSGERLAVAGNTALRGGDVSQLVAAATAAGLTARETIRHELADLWLEQATVFVMRDRIRQAVARGGQPGPEGALAKVISGRLVRHAAELGAELGTAASVGWMPADDEQADWAMRLTAVPGLAIGGGTTEIVKNIIGERILGLPR
jgi:alkylation response protein AidB-like acyl-CoA dehydrogenase